MTTEQQTPDMDLLWATGAPAMAAEDREEQSGRMDDLTPEPPVETPDSRVFEFGEPIVDKPRQDYLAYAGAGALRATAHVILDQLAAARTEVNRLKAELNTTNEAIEIAETRLQMSEAYAAGKNAEIRAAWLKQQRWQDPDLANALGIQHRLGLDLAAADAQYDGLSREYQLVLAEMRLLTAQLQFLAGEDGVR